MVNAGDLIHRLTIKRAAIERDADSGQVIPTWSILGYRWGKIDDLGGSESETANQIQVTRKKRITMRYFDGLTEADQLEYRGRTFHITGIIDKDEVRWIQEIDATEQIATNA